MHNKFPAECLSENRWRHEFFQLFEDVMIKWIFIKFISNVLIINSLTRSHNTFVFRQRNLNNDCKWSWMGSENNL